MRGTAVPVDSEELRTEAGFAAQFDPAERYILFELGVSDARCNGYGDVELPEPKAWTGPRFTD